MSLFRRLVATLAATSIAFTGVTFAAPAAAPAQLISTEQAAAVQVAGLADNHTRLHQALDRADLAAALQQRGVSTETLRLRVDSLTDAEAAQLLAQIDQAPAGGDVLGVLLTVFIVLLVTDLLGLTKVFPFTRSIR